MYYWRYLANDQLPRSSNPTLMSLHQRNRIEAPKAEKEEKQEKIVLPAAANLQLPQSKAPPLKPEKSEYQKAYEKRLTEARIKGMYAWPTVKENGQGEVQTVHANGNGYGNGESLETPPTSRNPQFAGREREYNGNIWNTRWDQRSRGQMGVLKRPNSEYIVFTGTKIPVKLIETISTETEGQITAIVTQDVYDSATGRYKLIPYGSTFTGSYSTRVTRNQENLPTAWHLLTLRDGSDMRLPAFPGINLDGTAGIPIETDNHTWETMMAALGMTLTGAASQVAAQSGYSGSDINPGDALTNQAGRELNSTGRNVFSNGLHRPPTGRGAGGTDFYIVTTIPLEFDGPSQDTQQIAYGERR